MRFPTFSDSLKALAPHRTRQCPTRSQPTASRLRIEELEDRLVPASLSVSDFSILEGNSGTRNAQVTVSLTGTSNPTVTVNYSTAHGTAVAGSDYQAVSGSLSFNRGVTSRSILVPIIGDVSIEATENFFVNLANAKHATIADGQGVVSIVNDDTRINIGDMTLDEGNAGTTNFVFTVSLSVAVSQPVTVSYATANGTATAVSDYQATSGSLTIPAGELSRTLTVPVIGDRLSEPDEDFAVNLSSPVNAVIGDGQGTGTIRDDEPRIRMLGMDAVPEGNTGMTELTCTVILSAASDVTVTVDYATVDDSASATDDDYTSATGTLSFAPGETSQTITLFIHGDLAVEVDECFLVNLSNPTNAQLIDTGALATIQSDDNAVLHIDSTWDWEPDPYVGGYTYFAFTVWLSAPFGETVTVDFATTDGTASDGYDYWGTSGQLTFAPGETSQTIYVAVLPDWESEWDETFNVILTNLSSNALIQPGWDIGTGTIFDNYYYDF